MNFPLSYTRNFYSTVVPRRYITLKLEKWITENSVPYVGDILEVSFSLCLHRLNKKCAAISSNYSKNSDPHPLVLASPV